jgi:hypothetical protein
MSFRQEISLLEDQQWCGEFFIPDAYEKRFQGKVSQSTENGILFEYRLLHKNISPCAMIYGILENGKKCTLIGDFNPHYCGFTGVDGLVTHQGKQGFEYLLIGEHLQEDEKFTEVYVTFSNMQEFFFPKGWKDAVKFVDHKQHIAQTKIGEIFVWNAGKFDFLRENVSEQIHCKNQDALNALQKSIDKISNQFQDTYFLLKRDISYKIGIKYREAQGTREIAKFIDELSDLFALLTYQSVIPCTIEFIKKVPEDNAGITINCCHNFYISPDQLMACSRDTSYHNLPLNASNISLDKVFLNWIDSQSNFHDFIDGIQNSSPYKNMHHEKGSFVLYATQLEQISKNSGYNKEKNKYAYPLTEYAIPMITEYLCKKFGITVNVDELGKAISDLRGDIAHVSQSKKSKYLNKFSILDLHKIGICLQLTIAGYIFRSLDFDKKTIEHYQYKLLPNDRL